MINLDPNREKSHKVLDLVYNDTDSIYEDIEYIKNKYTILYEYYYLGMTIEELKSKYNVEKSTIYNKLNEAKNKIRSEWYE